MADEPLRGAARTDEQKRPSPAMMETRKVLLFSGVGAGNLPGWRWATITKVALDRLSRSLHSDVCDSDGLRDAAIHSTISGRGGRRASAASNCKKTNSVLSTSHDCTCGQPSQLGGKPHSLGVTCMAPDQIVLRSLGVHLHASLRKGQ